MGRKGFFQKITAVVLRYKKTGEKLTFVGKDVMVQPICLV